MHRVSGGHHEVAGDVSGENMAEREEAREVDHSRYDAEQRRQPRLQAQRCHGVTRRFSERGGAFSDC
jgi:hypothetical protein